MDFDLKTNDQSSERNAPTNNLSQFQCASLEPDYSKIHEIAESSMPEEKIDHFLSTYNAPLNILVGITNGCAITLTPSRFVGLAETKVETKVDWNGSTFVWSD